MYKIWNTFLGRSSLTHARIVQTNPIFFFHSSLYIICSHKSRIQLNLNLSDCCMKILWIFHDELNSENQKNVKNFLIKTIASILIL